MRCRFWLSFALLSCVLGAPLQAAPESNGSFPHRAPPAGEESQQFIVKLRTGTVSAMPHITAAVEPMRALGDRAGVRLQALRPMTSHMHVVRIDPANGSIAEQLARLRADPEVEFAEVDQVRYRHAVPNDPEYVNQWFLHAPPSPTIPPSASSTDINSAIDAEHGWDKTKGLGSTVVAVLDTGVRYDHPDLLATSQGGKILPGFDFVSGESTTSFVRANDGNGYDADASDPGDWVDAADAAAHPTLFPATECPAIPDPSGYSSWHGTRVAGLLGALTDNGVGVAGIAWQPLILPVRVLGKCNGRDSDILNGMRWAAGLPVAGVAQVNPNPAKIINISLGSAGSCLQSYRTVISELTAQGVLVVASAGNDGGAVDSPANCPGVLAVAGLRHAGTKVGYSNLGAEAGLAAPAGNCYNLTGPCLYSLGTTTNLGGTIPGASAYTDQNDYNVGTSFSAPIVSAIAALMHGVNSHLGTAQLIARVKEGAVAFPADPALPMCPATDTDGQCNCTKTTCGAGMANAPRSITAALRPIASIASLSGLQMAGQSVPLDGSASVAADNQVIASYAWIPLGGASPPTGMANTAMTTVKAPMSGSASYRLTITDNLGATDHADVTVTVSAPASSSSGGGVTDVLMLAVLALAARYRFSQRTDRR